MLAEAKEDLRRYLKLEGNYRFVLRNIESYEVFVGYLKKAIKTKEEK